MYCAVLDILCTAARCILLVGNLFDFQRMGWRIVAFSRCLCRSDMTGTEKPKFSACFIYNANTDFLYSKKQVNDHFFKKKFWSESEQFDDLPIWCWNEGLYLYKYNLIIKLWCAFHEHYAALEKGNYHMNIVHPAMYYVYTCMLYELLTF